MLKEIHLENFRNHKDLDVAFDSVTAIIGKNGIGKSNILEAVSILSLCRSFREEDKKNLINYDAEYARVKSGELEVFLQRSPFILKTRYKGIPQKQSDFIGKLKTIVFSPESLLLINGMPAVRRKFLDMMISQHNHEYLVNLMEYEKIRSQRNSLLHRIGEGRAKESELEFWDQNLVEKGSGLIKSRKETVGYLNARISQNYSKISGKKQKMEIEYISNGEGDFGASLKQSRRKELILGRTIIGPHRDDLVFSLEGCNMANFASRGEMRSAVLALKIAELEYLKNGGQDIVLLLDDIFSEFDIDRRSHLGELIAGNQTIITTTDKDHFSKELLKESKIIEL